MNKKKISTITFISLIVLLMVAVSYASVNVLFESEENNINVGKLELTFSDTSSNALNIEGRLMTDEEGLAQEAYYAFSVENTGDANTYYKLSIIDDITWLQNYTGGVLDDKYVMIGLKKNGIELGPMNLQELNKIIDSGRIEPGSENKNNYELRLWLKGNLTAQEKESISNTAWHGKLRIYGEQLIQNIELASYEFDGNYKIFTAPYDGYYKIETWGAGQDVNFKGGYNEGTIYLTVGEKLYVYVGSQANGINGGWNGGGNSGTFNTSGLGGSGATDVRYFAEIPDANNLAWNSDSGLNARIMVAAGSPGGSAHAGAFGQGGGLSGTGSYGNGYEAYKSYGGTQLIGGAGATPYNGTTSSTAGTFGIGGTGGQSIIRGYGGGGGGGYYGGGGGGGATSGAYAGGGGSSFISGYAGVATIIEGSVAEPRNHMDSDGLINTKHYSEKYFFDGEMQIGINQGNGKAKIEFLGAVSPVRVNTNMNNAQYIKDCINGNTHDSNDGWVEFQAIHNGNNVAKGIIGTLYDSSNNVVTLPNASYITDGDITTENYASSSGGCYVIDLGSEYDLDEVAVWHYFEDTTSYYDNVISTSTDGTTWRTILNTFENETLQGKRVSAYRNTTHVLTIDPNEGAYNDLSTNTVVNVTEGETATIVDPTRTGYAFLGWTVTGTGSSINGTTFTMGAENATLIANWEIL